MPPRARSRPDDAAVRPVSEAAFQRQVVQLARLAGFLVYHTRDSRGSARGFPDLVLVKGGVVFAELKADAGRLTAEQRHWLDRLRAAGAEAHVWRPRDWPAVEARLLGGRGA